jgi:hypothetical protein
MGAGSKFPHAKRSIFFPTSARSVSSRHTASGNLATEFASISARTGHHSTRESGCTVGACAGICASFTQRSCASVLVSSSGYRRVPGRRKDGIRHFSAESSICKPDVFFPWSARCAIASRSSSCAVVSTDGVSSGKRSCERAPTFPGASAVTAHPPASYEEGTPKQSAFATG